jgi:subtilisin family serine protease
MVIAGVASRGTPEAAVAPSAAAGPTVRVVYRMHPNTVVRATGWLAARGISPESSAGAISSRQVTPHLANVDMRTIDVPTDKDGDGHGTHVAGIIAVATDNAVGVAGVAGNRPVSIIPVKVLADDGSGTTDAVAAGISWAVSKGAKIINLSLGSSAHTQATNTAIGGAVNAGGLVVVSAGNCGGAS